jgi:hypothetical protein
MQQLWVKTCFFKSGKLQKGKTTDLKKINFTSPCFFGSGIRDGKKSGSWINIPDPPHWAYF